MKPITFNYCYTKEMVSWINTQYPERNWTYTNGMCEVVSALEFPEHDFDEMSEEDYSTVEVSTHPLVFTAEDLTFISLGGTAFDPIEVFFNPSNEVYQALIRLVCTKIMACWPEKNIYLSKLSGMATYQGRQRVSAEWKIILGREDA
jgi:hypothetical protein